MRDNFWLFIASMVMVFAFAIILSCFEKLRRTTPWNYICLGIFTVSMTVMLCFCVATLDTEIVMYAVGITFAVFIGLTIFAFQTKIDFTVYYQMAFILLWCLILYGILGLIIRNQWVNLVYSLAGALIFCFVSV